MEQKINDKSMWCFILLLLFSAIIFPLKAYAIPAYDGTFVVNQPSGVSFEAKQHGDEWYNWIETKDGYGISRNSKTGNWEYYVPSADLKSKVQAKLPPGVPGAIVKKVDPVSLGIPKGLRPPKKQLPDAEFHSFQKKGMKNRLDKKIKSIAVSGTKNLLVIAVDYATTTATYKPADIQPLIFGASNSVADYYDKTSYSSVTITPANESYDIDGASNDGFIGWLRLSGSHPNTGQNTDTRNQQIAKDAIIAADPYIDYASYDTDGDGVVEPAELSIVIIVAGYEASYPSDSPSVWGHQWDMFLVGYPSVDGKTIQQYAQFGERHGNHLATIGIMAHELGHLMFSLPDLYDTNMLNESSEGIGAFDLMGSGSWGAASGTNEGSYPTQLSAWSKEYLSWGTVNVISLDQSASFPKTDGNSSSIFRINTPDSNQYFLLENRQFRGYDVGFQKYTGISGHGGLVIYHIDKLKTALWPSSNSVNAEETDKGVDVEEANEGSFGKSMLDNNDYRADTNMFFFAGNNGTFTNFTTPDSKLKNGDITNISVTDISNYSDTMTATISFIADTTPPTVISTVPSNESTDVAINTAITATFSELLNTATINSSTFTLSGATGTVSYDSSTKTATFTPSSNLNYSTTYTAAITTGVKDLSGNAMASNYTWSFTTMTPCADAYEPNDSFNTAYGTLTSGNSYTGKICSSTDVDYFKITAGNTGTISVTLSVPSDKDYDLKLYNFSQVEVASSVEGGEGVTESLVYNTSISGIYYIRIYGFDGLYYDETQTYTLSGTWPAVPPPLVTTGSATSVTVSSAVLNGTVNANGTSTTAWFDYGTVSASYSGSSTTRMVAGTSTTPVSIGISGLSSGTTYYYRVAALNSAGTSYGSETSFITATPPPPTTTTTTTTTSTTTSSTTTTTVSTTTTSSTTTTVPTTTTSSTTTTTIPTTTTSTTTTTTSSTTTTTLPDTTAPTVISTSPLNGATDVDVNEAITATFSESMDTTTISTSTFTLSGGVTGTVTYSGTTATFTPSFLSYATTYTATITTDVKDNAGNAMDSDYTWSFATLTVSPTVTTGIATDITTSSATLNGTVTANGLTTTAWFDFGTVSDSYNGSSTTQSINGTSTTPISIGISGLSFSTTYYYRIAAQNSAGTSYGTETSFVTSTPPPPTTTTTTTSSTTTSTTTTTTSTTVPTTTSSTTTSSTTTTIPTTTIPTTTTTVPTTTTSSTTTTVPSTATSSTTTTVPTTTSTTTSTTTTTTSSTTTTLPIIEGGFDRNNYLPSADDLNDYDRAWMSVTDLSGNTTDAQDTITVSIKAGFNSVPFVLKETGGTTTVFTTTGLVQSVMYPIGTVSGYVEDFIAGSHSYPVLGSSIVGLNLKKSTTNTSGDASTGSNGELMVAAGDTLELLYNGSTLDTASVGFNSGAFSFTPDSLSATTATDTVNLILTLTDPDENLNPVAKDVIGFADGSVLLAGNPGTGSSRIQVEAIDSTTGSALSIGGTDIVARHILLIETGTNTGVFTASGKVYGTTTTVPPSGLRGNLLVGSSAVSAYKGEEITLGDTTTGHGCTFRIIEANASGRIGLYEAGGTSTARPVLGFTTGDNFTNKGASAFGIAGVTSGITTTRVVAFSGTYTLFGNPEFGESYGTSAAGLHKLIEGDNYCMVVISSFFGTTVAGVTETTYETGNGGSVTVTLEAFQLVGPRGGDSLKVSYLDELNDSGTSGMITGSLFVTGDSTTTTTTTSTTTTTQSSGGGGGGGGGGIIIATTTTITTSSTTSTTVSTTTTSTTTTTLPISLPTPTPSVILTPTPTPAVCELKSISPSKSTLKLKGTKKYDVTVKLIGDDECPVANMEVTVKIDKAGKKCVSVSPTSTVTGAGGEVTFTIKAKKVTGRARITFKAGSLKRNLIVKVKA